MLKITKYLFGLILLTFCAKMGAQLSGNYTVPGNYASIAAAISDLNTQGVSGPVFINIAAGHIETAPAGGYALTATGTSLNPITFMKAGIGSNPLITAYTGGTGTPGTAVQDGIWRLVGSDYITIDGISLTDPNVTNPATMEYGFGLFKASTSNGCQNNTIRNCEITLNRNNNATGTGPAVDGSRGINVVNSLPASQTTVLTPISSSGTNSDNSFHSNTIQNCNIGIALIGYAAPSPFTLADTRNDIGGFLPGTGNTIVNFGGASAATNPAAGIRTLAQYDLNVSNNSILNNNGAGVNHTTTLRGIYLNTATSANITVTDNTLTINSGASTSQISAIENLSGATASNNTLSINNNLITNCTGTTNTTGSFFGIYNNGASAAYLDIHDNVFSGVNTRATTGSNYMIYNSGAVTGAITITNNLVSGCTNSANASGNFYGIYHNVVSPAVLTISGNTFTNCTSFASTGATHLIYNSSATGNSITIRDNLISACSSSMNSSGAFYGIFNNGASPASLEISSNSFINHTVTAFSGATHLIYNTATVSNSITLNDNSVSNCNHSILSGGSYYGIYNNAASSANLQISNNLFSGNSAAATTGSIHLIYNRGASTNTFVNVTLSTNLITNCTYSASSTSPFLGIFNSGVTSGNLSVVSNTVTDNTWATVSGARYLMYNTGPVSNTLNFNANLVANCSNTVNTTGTFNGMVNTGACTVALNMCGNTFTNTVNSASNGSAFMIYNSGAVAGGIITMTNNLISACTNSATGTADFYGIHNLGTTYSSLTISQNTFTNTTLASSTGATNLVYNSGAAVTTISSIDLSNNLIAATTFSGSSSGSFYGIYNNAASCLSLTMDNNTLTGNVLFAATGSNHFIYNRGALTNTFASVSLNNNLISACTNSASGNAAFYNIWNNGVRTDLTSIANNTITNESWATTTGLRYLISNWGVGATSITISNNLITNCTTTNNTTGSLFMIYNNNNTTSSSGVLTVNNNTLSNTNSSATSGETHYINSSGATSNTFAAIHVQNNLFSGCSSMASANGPFFGIYNNTASFLDLKVTGNTFSNNFLGSSTGATHLVYNRGVANNLFAAVSATSNLITTNTVSIGSTGTFYGILNGGAGTTSSASLTVSSNTFTDNVLLSSAGSMYMIHNTCPTSASMTFSDNLFSTITNTLTTGGTFYGINNGGSSAGGNLTISGNAFMNLISTASTGNRHLIFNNGGIGNSIIITNNLISGCSHSVSSNGPFSGINNNSAASGIDLDISSNTFSNNSTYATNGNVFVITNSGALTTTISNITISNNTVANYTSSATSGQFYGINNSGMSSALLSINTNTFSNILSLATANTRQFINNSGRVTNTISITNNLFSGYSATLNTGGIFYGISNAMPFANASFPSVLDIVNNRFLNHDLSSTSGAIYFISNTAVSSNTINSASVSNNLCTNINSTITANGAFYGINNNAVSCANLSVNSNSFTNIVANTATGARYMIFNGGLITGSADLSGNLVSSFTSTVNTTGAYYGIQNGGNSQGDLTITSNHFTDLSLSATTGFAHVIYNSGIITGSTTITNNLISDLSHTASTSGGFLGIYNNVPVSSSSNLNISANTFTNTFLSTSTGATHFIYIRPVASTANTISAITVSNNIIGTLSYSANSGPFYGIFNNLTTYSTLSIGSNTFSNIVSTTSTSPRYFIYNTGAGSGGLDIRNNLISNYSGLLNATGLFYNIVNTGAMSGNLDITGNTFSNQSLVRTTGATYLIYNAGAVTSSITVSNNLASGITHTATTGPFYGIYSGGSVSSANVSILSNTLANIASTTTTSARYLIYNSNPSAGAITIDNNVVLSYTSAANTSGGFYGIYNTGSFQGNYSASGNTVSGLSLAATSGTCYLIYNTGAGVPASVSSFSNNVIANCTHSASAAGTFYGIYHLASTSAMLNMSSNTFSNNFLYATTAAGYLIYNSGVSTTTIGSIIIDNNLVKNTSGTSTTGSYYGLHNNAVSSGTISFSNNTFTNCISATTSGANYLIHNTGLATGGMNFTNNLVADYTNSLNTSGGFYGLFNSASSQGDLNMSSNTFTNCSYNTVSGSAYLVYNTGPVTGILSFTDNVISAYTNSVNTNGHFFGLYNSGSASGSLSMSANSFATDLMNSSTGNTYLIYNTGSTGAIAMNTNTIAGCTNSTTTSGNFYGIYNTGASPSALTMNNNLFSNTTSAATTGNTYLIYNSGAVSNSITIATNSLSYEFTNAATDYSGDLNGIYNSGGTNATSLIVTNNNFSNYTFSGANGSGNIYFIRNSNDNSILDVTNNTWNNLSLKHNGNEYLIYNPSGTQSSLTVNNNSIVTGYARTGNAGGLFIYHSNGNSPAACQQVFSGNNFSNISANTQGTGSFYGFYSTDGVSSPYPKKLVYDNIISNVSYNGLGFMYAYYFDFLGDGSTSSGSAIYNNTLSAVSWGGPAYGLHVGSNVSPVRAVFVYSNAIQNLTSSGASSDIYGTYLLGGGAGLNFFKNKISDLSANGISGTASGIHVSSAANTNLTNNIIGNIYTPNSSAPNALSGIHIAGGSTVNVVYNTVHLNAVSSGSNFSSSAIIANASVNLRLQNNIFINTSTPSGAGIAAAYRRSSSSLSNYSSASNNNVFYAGVPSLSRLIFYDGTTAYPILPSYQALVSPRDNVSVSENTPFLSMAGTNANFLHINATLPSLTESGAGNVTGITDDFDNQVRHGNPGYAGTGSAPDIGADEYDQSLTGCAGATAGTVSIPFPGSRCAGETVYMLSTGYTAAGNIVHQWKVAATPGGPYVNVTGGSGANYVAYNTSTLSPGTYYYVLVTTCTLGPVVATSNEVTVTVNAVPSSSASVGTPTICSGQILNFSSGTDIGTNYNWYGPDNFTSTVQNPVVNNAVTNASGIYTLVISNANCTASPVYVNVTVHSTPPGFSLSPAATSLCVGSSQTITASIPVNSPTFSFGSQTSQNAASGYPAPYSVYYGGQKMQMLILAGELSAAGFTGGTPISSIQFPVVSLGSNWGSTLMDCQNFMVGIKATTVTLLSSFETGLANVVVPSNYTPAVGYNNMHNFSAPFIWDGSSNLVIETMFSNTIVGTSGNAVIQYNSPTGFQSTLVYRADNQTIGTIAAATTSNVNVGFVRPDFRLNGLQVGTYSWSPSVGLSSTTNSSVVATPTLSTVYSATLSNGLCSSNASMSIYVILIPTVNVSSTSGTVCVGNNATLTAGGAMSYTWSTSATGSSVIVSPFVSTIYTVTGSNPACPNASATISIISAPALTLSALSSPAILCQGESATLSVSGANTYTWSEGTTVNTLVVTPSVTTNYSVTGYAGPGCWANKAVSVKVNPLPLITISPPSVTLCPEQSVTLEAMGAVSFTWTPGNSNSPILTVTPAISTVYQVSGVDLNNCTNTASIQVVVDPCSGVANGLPDNKRLRVFPNPSTGIFIAEFMPEGRKNIQVMNPAGGLVLEISTLNASETINLSHLAKGLYLVRIDAEGFSEDHKLIVE